MVLLDANPENVVAFYDDAGTMVVKMVDFDPSYTFISKPDLRLYVHAINALMLRSTIFAALCTYVQISNQLKREKLTELLYYLNSLAAEEALKMPEHESAFKTFMLALDGQLANTNDSTPQLQQQWFARFVPIRDRGRIDFPTYNRAEACNRCVTFKAFVEANTNPSQPSSMAELVIAFLENDGYLADASFGSGNTPYNEPAIMDPPIVRTITDEDIVKCYLNELSLAGETDGAHTAPSESAMSTSEYEDLLGLITEIVGPDEPAGQS